jgi:hypothetical protein
MTPRNLWVSVGAIAHQLLVVVTVWVWFFVDVRDLELSGW